MEFNTHVMQALYPQEQVRKRRNMTWQFVQEDVLARIQNGTWPAGELIPTETELAAEYGCARATVNRALQVLADSGILERRRKVGTRVVVLPGGKPPAPPVTAAAQQPMQGQPAPGQPMAAGPQQGVPVGIPNQGPAVVPPLPAPVTIR